MGRWRSGLGPDRRRRRRRRRRRGGEVNCQVAGSVMGRYIQYILYLLGMPKLSSVQLEIDSDQGFGSGQVSVREN